MEWEKEKSLQLIDKYKQNELLWNPSHGSYYNKLKKKLWALISRSLGCSTEETKKKMESLLSSYRRGKAKGMKTIGTEEVYVSTWFAFNSMAFLHDRDKPRSTKSTLIPDDGNERFGQGQKVNEDRENNFKSQMTALDSRPTTPTKVPNTLTPVIRVAPASSSSSCARNPVPYKWRKMPEEDDKLDQALGFLKDVVSKSSSLDDECGLFSQYVANKEITILELGPLSNMKSVILSFMLI